MSGSFRDIKAWQKAIELMVEIYSSTRSFPREEVYGLANQLRRAAASVPSNIAEGKGRASKKELAYFLSNARGSLRELETQIIISARLHYIAPAVEQEFLNTVDDISRMLAGLINFASA